MTFLQLGHMCCLVMVVFLNAPLPAHVEEVTISSLQLGQVITLSSAVTARLARSGWLSCTCLVAPLVVSEAAARIGIAVTATTVVIRVTASMVLMRVVVFISLLSMFAEVSSASWKLCASAPKDPREFFEPMLLNRKTLLQEHRQEFTQLLPCSVKPHFNSFRSAIQHTRDLLV